MLFYDYILGGDSSVSPSYKNKFLICTKLGSRESDNISGSSLRYHISHEKNYFKSALNSSLVVSDNSTDGDINLEGRFTR